MKYGLRSAYFWGAVVLLMPVAIGLFICDYWKKARAASAHE